MNILLFDTLRSYYLADPEKFLAILKGSSSTAQVYKDMISEIISSLQSQFNTISAKMVRIDLDGNMMFSNNDAYFGQTKDDVKNISSRLQQASDSEFLVADGLGKKAFILKSSTSNYVGILKSMFIDDVSEEDSAFLNAVFGDVSVVINFPQIIWQYSNNKYITSFYLIPNEVQEIDICDDAIRSGFIVIRQGTTVKWVNKSNKPISIISGNTNYEQFQLNPSLDLYGSEFKSPVLEPNESWSYKFVTTDTINYFVYPDILTGEISVTENRLSAFDTFLVAESDNLGTPFSSRIIYVDSQGNVIKEMGNSYLVNPRSVRPLLNKRVIVSS